ncbi:MAG: hypothetical protein GQ532_18450 [Methylomarinum sp.]|nr:hypothetical protein [Methylomarinum sp.]
MSDILPPRTTDPEENMKSERIYRTGLSSKNYLRLETESIERGIKPFKLTQSIMTLYLNKQLVYVNELPEPIKNAIEKYYSVNPPTEQ